MIKLTKNSIIYTNQYNSESEKYVKKEVLGLGTYLNEVVKLSDDFTLGDLFKYIENEKKLFDIIFASHLGHHPLQPYIDEIKKPGPKEDDEIEYLALQRFGELWEWGEIDLSIQFGGESDKVEYSYGIAYSLLNELKHLPLRLNEDFSISEMKVPSRIVRWCIKWLKKLGVSLKKWDSPFSYTFVRGKVEFTVYELISEVLYEISFAGGPEHRDAQLVEIEDAVEEMKQLYEESDEEISDEG